MSEVSTVERPLHVVVVTYNSMADIRESLQSVARQKVATVVSVVDNASTDDTSSLLVDLKEEGYIDHVLQLTENVGFSKAVNIALRLVPDSDVLLFNPDAILDEGAIEELVSARNLLPRAGILSPVVYSGPNVRTTTAGQQPRLWPMFTHYSGLARAFRKFGLFRGRYLYLDDKMTQPVEVQWVAGCCMYIARETIDDIGFLSERWFMYGEDVEYCHRALGVDYKIWLIPSARCYHSMGASVTQSSTIRTWWPENLTDFYRTSYRPNALTFFLWRLVFSCGLVSRAAVFKLRSLKNADAAQEFEARRFVCFGRSVWRSSNVRKKP